MRTLPLLAAGQALGIVLADAGWLGLDAAVVLGSAALGLGALFRRGRALCATALALAGGGLALGSQLDLAARGRPAAPVEMLVEGRVGEVARGPDWTRVDLHGVAGVAGGRAPRRVRVHGRPAPQEVGGLESLPPGAVVRTRLRLLAPRDRHNPGARPRARGLARRGIGAEARLVHPALYVRLPAREGWQPRAGIERIRQRLAARLVEAGPGGGLLAALAVGDRRGLSEPTREAFARLGIAHLLAVSGLHLALVAGLLFALLRAGLRRSAGLASRSDTRRLALAGAILGAAAYAGLAGWGVPVRRALVLLLATALAAARARPARRGDALAGAALVVLAAEPGALFRAGAQLSFAATAALIFAGRAEGSAGGRLRRMALDAVRASAAAIAATAPLAAWQLGASAPFALVVNLLAIPWTGLVLLPAALLACAATLLTDSWEGRMLATLAGVAGATLRAGEALAARLPDAGIPRRPALAWTAGAAALGLLGIAARTTPARLAGAVGTGLLLALAPPPALAPGAPRLVALDVGQGDATLVQGRRAAMLVDAGGARAGASDSGRRVVLPALGALGIERLDLVVASHADLDHRGGLPAVLAALPVGELWLPRGGRREPAFAELLSLALRRGVPVRERGAGDGVEHFGDLAVQALWPPATGAAPASRNDRSLVLRVEVAGRRLLLPGDVEAAAEAALLARSAELRADVLLLPHHGSRSSSTPGFLAAVAPALVIASAPARSRFGMPHAEVRERVARLPARLWWTGRDGAVLVDLDGPLRVRGLAPSAP